MLLTTKATPPATTVAAAISGSQARNTVMRRRRSTKLQSRWQDAAQDGAHDRPAASVRGSSSTRYDASTERPRRSVDRAHRCAGNPREVAVGFVSAGHPGASAIQCRPYQHDEMTQPNSPEFLPFARPSITEREKAAVL